LRLFQAGNKPDTTNVRTSAAASSLSIHALNAGCVGDLNESSGGSIVNMSYRGHELSSK